MTVCGNLGVMVLNEAGPAGRWCAVLCIMKYSGPSQAELSSIQFYPLLAVQFWMHY